MLSLIQYLKDIFLLITTLITIFLFLKNYKTGFYFYLIVLIISGFLGFARPIFAEEIVLPIIILLSVITSKQFRLKYISSISLFLFLYTIGITIISDDASFKGYDTIFFFGIVLIIFSKYFFGEEKKAVQTLAFLWLYALARVLWLIIHGDEDIFRLANITVGSARLILIDTNLKSNFLQVDPNYFAFITGLGFLLTLLFLVYRRAIFSFLPYSFIRKKWFLIIVIIIGFIELWFTIRAVSRGMVLALLAAVFTYLIFEKKAKVYVFSFLIIGILYAIFQTVFNLYLERFGIDDLGGGRYNIWSFLVDYLVKNDKIWFGSGLNFPWWEDWTADKGKYLGTHNSWLSLIVIFGLFGFSLLLILIIKSVRRNLQSTTTVSRVRIILFTYVLVSYSSIEPLNSSLGWILLAVCISNGDTDFLKTKKGKTLKQTAPINTNINNLQASQ